MKALLKLDPGCYKDLMDHLFPRSNFWEQAAFLFAKVARADHEVRFEVVEVSKMGRLDFAEQAGDYLELADGTRARLIKRAHDLGSSIVEMHSHPGPWKAAFSFSDRVGLKETVPHMWWRLKGKPYLALVVAKSGFDALLWLDQPKIPRPLDALLVGEQMLRPTNNSLEGW